MAKEEIIRILDLSTQFGEQVVHDRISFSVRRGEILGIVGGSGTGKSVLLRFMMGLNPTQSGTIEYLTIPPYPSQQIGVLFQSGALLSSLTVIQNIMLPLLEMPKLPQSFAFEVAMLKLRAVGLSDETAHKYPAQISGGMTKRVGLARALALDPEILFFDEPTSGLDPISAAGFDNLILQLPKTLGITIVMVSHDLDSLKKTCDRVAVLVDKKVIIGTIEEVVATQNSWVQSYFHGERGERVFG